MSTIGYRAMALGIAGALAIGITASSAGPLPTSIATMKQAAPDQTTEVQWGWRGYGGWGPGLAFGLAAGAFAGAALAQPYYGYGGYYARPVYAAPYGYAPAYGYGPPVYRGYYGGPYGYYGGYGGYGYRRCFTDEGYGRYKPCSAP